MVCARSQEARFVTAAFLHLTNASLRFDVSLTYFVTRACEKRSLHFFFFTTQMTSLTGVSRRLVSVCNFSKRGNAVHALTAACCALRMEAIIRKANKIKIKKKTIIERRVNVSAIQAHADGGKYSSVHSVEHLFFFLLLLS